MDNLSGRRLPLTVTVLTLNEERHLSSCLASARKLTDRILVIDSGSTDRTREIALSHGAEFREHRFTGYADQRNAALQMIEDEWVLFLDADEYLPDELVSEIQNTLVGPEHGVNGYWISRDNRFQNRPLRGGGWWPDAQLRLLRSKHGHYDPEFQVHERVILTGMAGHLQAPMVHDNFDSFSEFRAIQRRYSDMQVEHYLARGDVGRRRTIIGRPLREFWRRFISLHGYRNGLLGLFLALSMAWYEFRTWWLVRRRRHQSGTLMNSGDPVEVRLSEPDPALDLSVIIVSYNTSDLLSNCLSSIEAWFESNPHTGEVVVVDNASADGTANMIRRRFPEVRLIENHHNAGFAAATNQGIRAARGRHLVLLNPDTTVVGDAFGHMANWLDRHTDVAMVGPRLEYPDGTIQSSRRRFPTRLTGFLESTLIQDYWWNNRVLRRYYMSDQPSDRCQDVDWLVGACLMVRREAIESAGLLDERFFMYSEEVEWCYRLKQLGWRVIYLPGATVIHHEGSSSSQNVPARQINFDSSKVLLYRQLHGEPTALSLHLFLLTTYLIRIAIESSKGLIGHKRSMRWERVSMYCRVLVARIRGSGGVL